MKILITGSNGFLGKNLIAKLENSQHKIIGISTKQKNLKSKNIKFVRGNLSNKKIINKWIKDVDLIIHLAAFSDVKNSFINPKKIFKSNIESTFNILEALTKLEKKPRLIFLSSSAVYGNDYKHSVNENEETSPRNPFAMSKIVGEKLCQGFSNSFDIPITVLRPFTIYGSDAPKHQVIPKIMSQIKQQEIIINNPDEIRDFIFIDDVVSVILYLIKKQTRNFMIYNIGTGKGHKMLEIAKLLIEIHGNKKTKLKIGEKSIINKRKMVADNNLILKNTNWKPKIDIVEGIKKIKI